MAEKKQSEKELVDHAKPYAVQCGDIDSFARECSSEVERSGEPAFFMETLKQAGDPKRFPAGLQLWAFDEEKGETFVVANMDLERPKYKDNPHGFRGNHLVVALLDIAREKAQAMVPEGVTILTSRMAWMSLLRGDGYRELKSQRALNRFLPPDLAGPKSKRSRL